MRFFPISQLLLAGLAATTAAPGLTFHYSAANSPEDRVLREFKTKLDHVLKVTEREGAGKTAVEYLAPEAKAPARLEASVTSSSLLTFLVRQFGPLVDELAEGGAKPRAKKESKPKSSSAKAKSGSVLKLNGHNFKSTVMGSEKAFFIKFYAPWCGHCKAMEDDWKQLAAQVNIEELVIAEVDADAEKELAHEYGVQGFPTLIFFPTGDSKAKARRIPYNGPDRSLKSLLDFVKQHASHAQLRVKQLTSQTEYDKYCGADAENGGLCLITFLPHMLDSSVSERKGYIKTLNKVLKATAELPIRHFWAEAGNSFALEQFFRLEFGWPATILINQHKGVFATHRGRAIVGDLTDFASGVVIGKFKPDAFDPSKQPPWPQQTAWDGKAARTDEL